MSSIINWCLWQNKIFIFLDVFDMQDNIALLKLLRIQVWLNFHVLFDPRQCMKTDRLEFAQVELDIAEVLHDGYCKNILPDSFNSEPCLSQFSIKCFTYENVCPSRSLKANDSTKESVDRVQISYQVLEPQNCTYSDEHVCLFHSKLMSTNSADFI